MLHADQSQTFKKQQHIVDGPHLKYDSTASKSYFFHFDIYLTLTFLHLNNYFKQIDLASLVGQNEYFAMTTCYD